MEEYRDEFTSFEHDEKTNKVANAIVSVVAAGVILFYLVYGAIAIMGNVANYPVFAIVLGIAVMVLAIIFVFTSQMAATKESSICTLFMNLEMTTWGKWLWMDGRGRQTPSI